jgi:hypothetical protein
MARRLKASNAIGAVNAQSVGGRFSWNTDNAVIYNNTFAN